MDGRTTDARAMDAHGAGARAMDARASSDDTVNFAKKFHKLRKKINFASVGWREGTCATCGILANGQVSCPDMAILKISSYFGNCCP